MRYANRNRAPFNDGLVSQEAAIAALQDNEHVEHSRSVNQTERARLTSALSSRGLEVTLSQTNFVLTHFGRAAEPLYTALLQQGVIVRPLALLPQCLRITVGRPVDNERLLAALDEVLG
jgi:histidinol-phosphate aminotransferase